MAGRTLLQQAVPVTFGLVAAGWLTAIDDAGAELGRVRDTRLAIQFGGAAGTLASLGRCRAGRGGAARGGSSACRSRSCPGTPTGCGSCSWPPRWPGVCAALGKVARDVTLLAQTEVAEVAEGAAASRGRGGVVGDAA